MGEVRAKFRISNIKLPLSKELEFLVDSGSTISVIPADILKALNIETIYRDEFELADGSTVLFDIGQAVFSYNGKSIISQVDRSNSLPLFHSKYLSVSL